VCHEFEGEKQRNETMRRRVAHSCLKRNYFQEVSHIPPSPCSLVVVREYGSVFSMSAEELEPDEVPAPFWPNLWRIARLLRCCWGLVLVSLIVMILKRWSSLMENVLGGTIVDAFHKSDYGDFAYQTSLLTASYTAYTILQVSETFLLRRITSIIGRKIKMDLFTCLMSSKSQAFFDQEKSGDLSARLSGDCDTVCDNLSSWVPITVTEVFEIGFGVVYMLVTNMKLSGAIAILLPTMAAATWLQTKWEMPLQEEHTKLNGKVNADAVETIMHAKTVKIFGQQRREIAKFGRHLTNLDALNFKLGIASSISGGLVTLSYHICLIVTFWYGGSLVLAGELSTGQFLAFCLFALSLSDSVNYLPDLNSRLSSIIASAERVYSVIENSTETDLKLAKAGMIFSQASSSSAPTISPPTPTIAGNIKFEKVSFCYPSRPDTIVLQNFDLEIQPGQSAALVGSSGSGKSTIVSLLTRLYDNVGGKITIDGFDISTMEPNWLRKQIGLVSQEPVLFAGSIRENICYGLIDYNEEVDADHDLSKGESCRPPRVSQERVEEVAKMANAHDFIVALPNGYDTLVGELGSMLSAGQRQRIAIARALLRDPKILIADEATSALDNASERIVQQALDRLMQGRTCIVIAHRLSTIRNCYPICYMGKGHILERGAHSELLSIPNGHYAKLHTYETEEDHLHESMEIQKEEEGGLNEPELDGEHPSSSPVQHPLDSAHSPRTRHPTTEHM